MESPPRHVFQSSCRISYDFFQYPECARCRKYSEGYVGADCCAMLKTDYLFHVDRAKRRDDVMHPLVEKI